MRRWARLMSGLAGYALVSAWPLLLAERVPWGALFVLLALPVADLWRSHRAPVEALSPEELRPATALGLAVLGAVWLSGLEHAWLAQSSALGLPLALAGIGLRAWAIGTLGEGFVSAVAPVVPRVRTGPYRWLRHPSELGTLLALTGLALTLGSLLGLAWVAVVVTPLSWRRARAEDGALA